ncbi:hypothetical protein B0H11DRAFT_1749991, partial [Mycena galericulata]
RGLLSPWLYLNYARPDQPVYDSYGEENHAALKRIKEKYDPENVLGRLQALEDRMRNIRQIAIYNKSNLNHLLSDSVVLLGSLRQNIIWSSRYPDRRL